MEASSLAEFLQELLNRFGRVAGEMIIDERQDRHALTQFLDRLGIGLNLVRSIDHDMVERGRQLIDFFPIPEQAHIRERAGYHVRLVHQVPGRRHPALVRQDPDDVMAAEQLDQLRREPVLVAQLDRDRHVLRPSGKKRIDAVQEGADALESLLVEVAELQDAAEQLPQDRPRV